MGDVINLRQVRKSKRRADDADRAQANRPKHGRSKADKRLAAAATNRIDAAVEGARRQPVTD
jgi:hypothetical protein